ncbi:ATP-binding protein [Thermodesulfobium sp.]|jgi:predicted AAA+ superfamily ATPase|uniref:ATP-binding protein n=1 Tax=Thermodesulfobium narugense TaxID=184064 RepID=A0A7C5KE60_9BACT
MSFKEDLKEVAAFRFKDENLMPIHNVGSYDLEKFLGIDEQIKVLLKNTLKFVKKLPASDVLLWGERGTGKSSLVKAMLSKFFSEGLRIIQIYKSQISDLSILYGLLRNEDYRFILFFDDLSFTVGEDSWMVLKALLDGDIEERPYNVLVYATSNRRHLTKEEETNEKFENDTYRETISLIERFGIRLSFPSFSKEQYLDIVKNYAKLRGLEIDEDTLNKKALEWVQMGGSFTGRSAFQFVEYQYGEEMLKKLDFEYIINKKYINS